MKAVILAGGFATRLWPLTDAISKPLLAVGDKPMVSYLVEKIPSRIPIIISTNRVFADDYKEWQKQFHPKRNIEIFIEDSQNEGGKLGALRAISYLIKAKKLKEDLLIVAGDNFITFDIGDMLKKYRGQTMVGAYNIGSIEEARNFGVIEMKIDTPRAKSRGTYYEIVGFEEKPSNPKSTFVSTAVYILPREYFNPFHKVADEAPDNIGNFVQTFVKSKIPVNGFTFSGKWYDVGSFNTYLQLHKDLSSTQKSHRHLINCKAGGTVYVDDSAQVSESVLENAIIFGGSKVHNSVIRNAVIGKNCTIECVDVEGKIVPTDSIIRA